jgi:hypothetical protein
MTLRSWRNRPGAVGTLTTARVPTLEGHNRFTLRRRERCRRQLGQPGVIVFAGVLWPVLLVGLPQLVCIAGLAAAVKVLHWLPSRGLAQDPPELGTGSPQYASD